MEASALHAPSLARRALPPALLRLRSDEQLVALFRAGSEEAFTTIHDRYRQRLFAYVRQMLSASTRADAEDVLQDVFVRAYGTLRADRREINVRAWLYRVAHNRCIDQLRRPTPAAADVFDLSRTPLQDPIESAQRREDLRRLVADVGRLPEQQRSALLMREIDGLAYTDIAAALDVTVPAVKSLLVRARVGLVEAIEARDTDCSLIRGDLLGAYDRGVKASARARKHLRECAGCREYRGALRAMRRSFASLTPAVGLGPLALVAKALGLGGASGGAAAGGSATVGGAGLATTGVAACKVAAVVCTAALATGGAVEATHLTGQHDSGGHTATVTRVAAAGAGIAVPRPTPAAAPSQSTIRHRTASAPAPAAATRHQRVSTSIRVRDKAAADGITAPATTVSPILPTTPRPADTAPTAADSVGGSAAPDDGARAKPVKGDQGTADQPTAAATPTSGDGTAIDRLVPGLGGQSRSSSQQQDPQPADGGQQAPGGPAPQH